MLGSLNAPITGFVNVLAANIRGFVTVLDAIAKKQAA
jgi:large subunit ribosomal protein L10